MNILEASISKTGSIANLARDLGVRPNVVSNWRSRGAPYSWQQVMSLKYTGLQSCNESQPPGAQAHQPAHQPAQQGAAAA